MVPRLNSQLRVIEWLKKGLSRVRANPHARFLGELWLATVTAYPIPLDFKPL
jgi:hypothetical protein